MPYTKSMYIFQWIKNLFSKEKKEDAELEQQVAIVRLSQEIHAETIAHLIESLKNSDEFRSLVINAISNLDNRLDQAEKLINYMYDKSSEYDSRLESLENRTTKEEFSKLVALTKDS